MRRCPTCKDSDRAVDGDGTIFYCCRARPPAPIWTQDGLIWRVPPMMASGWCGLHRLSIRKWLASLIGNGQGT